MTEQAEVNRSLPAPIDRRRLKKFLSIGLVLIALIAGSYLLARADYLVFHSLADGLTVFVAGSVFLVVWHGRRQIDNYYFLFVSIAFLFFAVLDFLHLLGNKNMGVFPQFGKLGTTFYIASRYLLGVSFLIAPIFIKRKFNPVPVLLAYSAVTLLVILSVFTWKIFPVTYIEGVGLTRFKVISDYFVCLMLVGATGLVHMNRRSLDPSVMRTLTYALALSIGTGLAFTLYSDPFGVMNMVGHLFQIGSFVLFYRAIVETTLTRPQDLLFRTLKQSEESLKLSEERLSVFVDSARRPSPCSIPKCDTCRPAENGLTTTGLRNGRFWANAITRHCPKSLSDGRKSTSAAWLGQSKARRKTPSLDRMVQNSG